MKKLCLLLTLVWLTALVVGCGKAADNAGNAATFCTVVDDMGRTVSLDKKPERIVAVSASFLEPLYAVGGSVVGRPTSKNKAVDFAAEAIDIGPVYQIDSEKLLSCRPDLVIINKGMNERLLGILADNNIPAVVVEMKTYEDVKREIALFGQITGQTEKSAAIVGDMDARIKNLTDKLPKEPKRAAIIHSTAQGLSIQLDNSIAGNVLNMLGGVNVAAGMTALKDKPDTAPYSLETLVEQNPEIIFVTSMGDIDDIKRNFEQMIADNPAWQAIPAVQDKRLYYLPQDLFLFSPGLHYPEAAEVMAELIYPEATK